MTGQRNQHGDGRLVVIFGGSGFLGRHLVQRLARQGYALRIGVRHPNNALFLKPMGKVGQIEPVAADIRDTNRCVELIEGAFAVVNLVGILQESRAARFDEIHAHAPARLAEKAASLEVARFVQVSALGAGTKSPAHYARSKALGESLIQAAFPRATCLRPSIIFGPEDGFFNRFATMAQLSPVLPLIGGGRMRFQPVFVGDVAAAIAAALERDELQGKTYELGGGEILSFRQLLEIMLEVIERKRLLLPLPFPVAELLARCLGWIPNAPLTLDQLQMLRRDNIVSAKAIEEKRDFNALGIEPYPLRAVLPSYLARFRPAGEFSRERKPQR